MTEVYVVDETICVDSTPDSNVPSMENHSRSIRKLLEVGSICNNASASRDGDGMYIGQSTDVALLNILSTFGLEDMRQVIQRIVVGCLELTILVQVVQPIIRAPFQFGGQIHGRERYRSDAQWP